MQKLPLLFLVALHAMPACADEFTDFAAEMGTTTKIIGMSQATTNNPDGTAINFWQPSFEGAPASSVALSNPHNMGADAFGNIYVADKASHSILKITKAGTVHTLAGAHTAGFNGDGPAPATSLQLNNPNGLFVFPDGTVFLLDPGNQRIRRIGTDGVMTTVVVDPEPNWFPSGRGLWVSREEDLIYYTHEFAPVPPSLRTDGSVVKKWTPSGGIEVVCNKATGFLNPGNLAVNPINGLLYVTDRAENDPGDTMNIANGLFRIDAPNSRTRMTGNATKPVVANGQLAINSYIRETRGIAFLPNGAYFICGHKEGSVWYVDTAGVVHQYLRGRRNQDNYLLPNGAHPPLLAQEYFSQPRALTITPDGSLLCVSNDSGFIFKVSRAAAPHVPEDFHAAHLGSGTLRLEWTGLFSRGYIVERTLSLLAPDWQPIGAAAGMPAGVPAEFMDADAGAHGGAAFYRLTPPQ